MNIDMLKDEIGILKSELLIADDPATEMRIKEMIDERQSIIDEQAVSF
jgi:hypothetical protein